MPTTTNPTAPAPFAGTDARMARVLADYRDERRDALAAVRQARARGALSPLWRRGLLSLALMLRRAVQA